MPEHDAVDEPAPANPELRVTVTRTGGFAGLRREWCAEPGAAAASLWHDLIARCPWESDDVATVVAGDHRDADADAAPGADRFTWRIRVDEHGRPTHGVALADHRLEGAWVDLIEAVREAHRSP